MRLRAVPVNQELINYIRSHTTPLDVVQNDLVAATKLLGDVSSKQIGATQAALMTFVTKMLKPRLAVEVGTFTGYSSLAIARGLPDNGRLLCCDVSTEWTSIAQEHWKRANVEDRIDLRIGPAIETLKQLPIEPCIDLAFIDADKAGYISYYEEIVPRLSPDGVILADNVLWQGRIYDLEYDEERAEAMRRFNTHVANDTRVDVMMLTVGDGMSIITLRSEKNKQNANE